MGEQENLGRLAVVIANMDSEIIDLRRQLAEANRTPNPNPPTCPDCGGITELLYRCPHCTADLRRQLAEANARIMELAESRAELAEQRNDLHRNDGRLREALAIYGEHGNQCPFARVAAGGPTPDGGYQWKVRGKWYPDQLGCTCGLRAALVSGEATDGKN